LEVANFIPENLEGRFKDAPLTFMRGRFFFSRLSALVVISIYKYDSKYDKYV
jgi:hypothetical protein